MTFRNSQQNLKSTTHPRINSKKINNRICKKEERGCIKLNLEDLKAKIQTYEKSNNNTQEKKKYNNTGGKSVKKMSYTTLKKNEELSGIIIKPKNNGTEQESFIIKEVYKFGKDYIQRSESVDGYLDEIPKLRATIDKNKSIKDYELSFELIENLYIPIFNQEKNPNITILNFRKNYNIQKVFKSLYKLVEEFGDNIYQMVVTFKVENDWNISVKQKSKIIDSDAIFNKYMHDVDEVKQNIHNSLNFDNKYTKNDVNQIVNKWISSILKLKTWDKENLSDSVEGLRQGEIQKDDQFFKYNDKNDKDDNSGDIFSEVIENDSEDFPF